jgi:hypothetical protein
VAYADHNIFDLPVLDVLYVGSFFYVMILDFVVSKSFFTYYVMW